MYKFKTTSGYIAYKVSIYELEKLGGFGFCDGCNALASVGYLIPLLNYYYCPDCFDRWQSKATYHIEDAEYEIQVATYYERVIEGTA